MGRGLRSFSGVSGSAKRSQVGSAARSRRSSKGVFASSSPTRRRCFGAVQEFALEAREQQHLIDNVAERAATFTGLATERLRTFFLGVVSRIQVHAETIEIALDTSGLMRWLASSSVEQLCGLAGTMRSALRRECAGAPLSR